MNSKFDDDQIRAYAGAFESGDAIWCDGEWREVKEDGCTARLTTYVNGNNKVINFGSRNGGVLTGFRRGFKGVVNPYRVTTLADYELQGGEKIVWLGAEHDFVTFGNIYIAKMKRSGNEMLPAITLDDGDSIFLFDGAEWSVIPRYEQVKESKRSVRGMNSNFKFKVGDKVVALDCHVGIIMRQERVGKQNGYIVKLFDGDNQITKQFYECYLKPYKKSNVKISGEGIEMEAGNITLQKSELNTLYEGEGIEDDEAVSKGRPASSHYHSNNNGNDVWNFADDNLSEERVKGFHQINAIKYVSRYNKKHNAKEKRIEDLKKAKVSIDKLIELERKG